MKHIEMLADIQHLIWAHWMRYMLDKGGSRPGGIWIMDIDKEERWRRQMNTPYSDLSEHEQQADRNVVLEYMQPVLDLLKEQEKGEG